MRRPSNISTSFALHEASFLTDDALLIEETKDRCMALPSHASLRLWEDSLDALIDERTAMASSISYSTKARLLAGKALAYSEDPQPLLAAFVLDQQGAEVITIRSLSGLERYMSWIGNSFLLDIEDHDLLSQHFEWTHRISGAVPTFALDYPRAYGILPDIRNGVREHLQ